MQQLGQKFLQKYHCPVYPPYVALPAIFSKKLYENITRTHAFSWLYCKPSNVIHIFHDVSRHTNSRIKTACYLNIARCKNNSFVKSVLILLKGVYLHRKMHSRASPHRADSLSFKVIDSINVYVIIL